MPRYCVVCLFSVANGASSVQKKLGFGVRVRVRVSGRYGVSATSFNDFLQF